MRHKYVTRGIVLARTGVRESGVSLTLLTEELGLVRARAEGLRKPGAKLASALQTLSESDVTLVRGKETWRLAGALLQEDRFRTLAPEARTRAARFAGLLLRLVPPDSSDRGFYPLYVDFLNTLRVEDQDAQDHAECIAALTLLVALGLDDGPIDITVPRTELVRRINRGITASGL